MRHTRLLCAIAVSVWASAVAGRQAESPAALPAELRAHVQGDRFQIVSSLRGLPLGVRAALQTLFGSRDLDIAEPGAAFRGPGPSNNATLPSRRLVAAGCSYEDCLVYYERAGARTWRVALFHSTPDGTRFEWGGAAPGGLTTIDDVRRAVLSGAIKGPAESW